ncbi:MAG: acyl-CoA thioesterase domain-containing protein [Ilumatobacteraceae bacterium]
MNLGQLLDLVARDNDIYVGEGLEYPWGGLYGGHIVAQALRAAAFTVSDDMIPHSIRAYFIRRGDHLQPVQYEVDRIRDGKSFTTRRVVARQGDNAILNLESSFHRRESSDDVTTVEFQRNLPSPETLEESSHITLLERRMIGPEVLASQHRDGSGRVGAWMRAKDSLGESELLNRCALAYISDDLPTESVICAIPGFQQAADEDRWFGASLDHTVWFHRPVRAHEWHFYEMTCHTFVGGRGLTFGYVFDAGGIHVATIAQEVLLRVTPKLN